MSSFALGNKPQDMTVNLNDKADFIATMRTASGADWPVGTVVTLLFHFRAGSPADVSWPATVTDDTLVWDVDKVAVAEVYADAPTGVQLLYASAGGEDDLWASGRVSRNA